MNEKLKKNAINIIINGLINIIDNYTDNALLINSCNVARERYTSYMEHEQYNEDIDGPRLSTTHGIPTDLRLDTEIDVQFSSKDLVAKYRIEILEVIFKNYLIISISLIDAILEELYELLIKEYFPDISNKDLNNKVRNAWSNDNLLKFFIDPKFVNLKKPVDLETEFEEAFMRYKELRIIRHSLLHTNGKISDKNYKKLQEYLKKTPEVRKGFSMIKAPIIDENRNIKLSLNNMLSIRQYLYRFLTYLKKSLEGT